MHNRLFNPLSKKLVGPKELAEYHSRILEIQQMVVATHMPMAELLGLTFTPKLIYRILEAIRLIVRTDPVNLVGNIVCLIKCSNSKTSFSVDEFYPQIDQLYQDRVAIDNWPSSLTGNAKKIMGILISASKACKLLDGNHFIQSNKQEIKKILTMADEIGFLKHCEVFNELYQRFQNQGKAEIEFDTERKTVIDSYNSRLISKAAFETNINILESKRKETLTELASMTTQVFSRFNVLDQMQKCVTLTTGIIVNLTGLFISKMLLKRTLRNYPLGVFPYFYKNCRDKAHLITTVPVSIRTDDYRLHLQQLEAIKKDITPWYNLLIMVMRASLLVSWLVMLLAYISENKHEKVIGVLMGFLQPLILAYALQGLFPFLKERYQHYQRNQLLKNQLTYLNTLSHSLSLPSWKVEIKPRINTGYFLLELPLGIYQEVNVKIISNAILECFLKNKIKITFHSNRQFVLPESILLLDKNKIEKITADVKIAINLFCDQKNLYGELKKLADQLKLTFYRVDAHDSQTNQPNYCFVIKHISEHEPSINQFLNLLKQVYGDNRIKIESISDRSFITVAYGKPSSNSGFLELFKNLRFDQTTGSVALTSSLIVSENQHGSSEPTQSAIIKRRSVKKDNANETSSSVSSQSKSVISFGKYGEYDSNKTSSQIKEIRAPFWPRQSHFMLFAATKEMFATDQQCSNFQNIEPRIVPKKGHKGIVSSGGAMFSNRGHIFSSKLKLKDPTEDLRVYDHVERFKTTEGKEVHLHVFDHVVSKSH